MGAKPEQATKWCREFGTRVRTLREERGLTQMALAHAVDLHPTYISGIERGVRNVSLVNIHQLALGLAVHPSILLETEG